ncbi:HNH endonuclease [Nocardioides pakistanensis]
MSGRTPCPLGEWTGTPGNCNWCDKPIPAGGRRRTWCSDPCRRVWERNHIWRRARIYARKRAKYRCSRTGCAAPRMDVEINHIVPRNGAGYGPGCHHHQTNLEALCHDHHVEVTNAQRAARKAAQTQEQTAA